MVVSCLLICNVLKNRGGVLLVMPKEEIGAEELAAVEALTRDADSVQMPRYAS